MNEDRGPKVSNPTRQTDRAVADYVVEVYGAEGGLLRAIARLVDLSPEGACVESTAEFMEGDEFTIRFLLSQRHLVVMKARTVWKRSYAKTVRYGLRFLECPAAVRPLIANFVREFSYRLSRMGPWNINSE